MVFPFNRNKEEQRERQMINEGKQMAIVDATLKAQTTIEDERLTRNKEILVQLTQWQQDRKPSMVKIFQDLSGCLIVNNEMKAPEEAHWNTGVCSMLGAKKLVDFIETLDHNVMLATWDEKALNLALKEGIAGPLKSFIRQNHLQLGIKLNHATYVLWLIINTLEPNYRRGLMDGERKKDREIIKISEIKTPQQENKPRKLFGIPTG